MQSEQESPRTTPCKQTRNLEQQSNPAQDVRQVQLNQDSNNNATAVRPPGKKLKSVIKVVNGLNDEVIQQNPKAACTRSRSETSGQSTKLLVTEDDEEFIVSNQMDCNDFDHYDRSFDAVDVFVDPTDDEFADLDEHLEVDVNEEGESDHTETVITPVNDDDHPESGSTAEKMGSGNKKQSCFIDTRHGQCFSRKEVRESTPREIRGDSSASNRYFG